MRIAFIVTRSDTIGGSHVHVRDMGVALMNDGNHVGVFIGGNGPIVNMFESSGLVTYRIANLVRNISPLKDIKAFYELKNSIKSFSPDIISTHSSKAGYLGRMAASRLEIPVLFTAHGWSFTSGKSTISRYIFRMLEKIVAPITDKIITVSEYDRQLALKYLTTPNENVITIHNGMGNIHFKTNELHHKHNPVNIVKIARFDHQKDHAELLSAIHNLDNIHIHFVGDGPLMKNVKKQSDDLGISHKVTFWGRLDDVNDIIQLSDIFVLISNWEGFPRSTLEAMRAGIPTVVSDVGGAAEAVEEGVTGFVIKKGDISRLHEVIKMLVNNPVKRVEMGMAARRRFEKYFTFQIMYTKTTAVYSEILNKNKFVT